MSKIHPSIPKGTRDFNAEQLNKRYFILNTVKAVYELFGFEPIETPTMEKLDVLTGKYGDEGEQLLFSVLDSGDFLSNQILDDKVIKQFLKEMHEIDKVSGGGYFEVIEEADWTVYRWNNRYSSSQSKSLSNFFDIKVFKKNIAFKALRYDLTVPFARYVAQHRNDITFPFKRYQMQPVWRADRPQKGRYREFYQCDADVIGTNSLLAEFEFIQIYDHVFRRLGLKNYRLRLNNRKILAGLAESMNASDKFMDLTIAIDKLDKIGIDGVLKELENRSFNKDQQESIRHVLEISACNEDKINQLKEMLSGSSIAEEGISEMESLLNKVSTVSISKEPIVFDITLARGLSYYTGTIFEAVIPDSGFGSVSGGGRYDDLTSVFGLNDVSGVGISFGLDRLYDVMESQSLWPPKVQRKSPTKVLVVNMEKAYESAVIDFVEKLRFNNINAEMYLEPFKLKKQFKYANDKGIPAVVTIGSRELESGKFSVKWMEGGQQQELEPAILINALKRL